MVVPFGGSYLEPYKVIPKRNYYGAYGYRVSKCAHFSGQLSYACNAFKAFIAAHCS